jgi:hypothetical protein
VVIRRTDDPTDVSFTADMEPGIVSEYQRRAPVTRVATTAAAPLSRTDAAPSPVTQALDAALLASVIDSVLPEAAVAMLARMSIGLNLVPNEEAGRAVVLAAAARLGVPVAG